MGRLWCAGRVLHRDCKMWFGSVNRLKSAHRDWICRAGCGAPIKSRVGMWRWFGRGPVGALGASGVAAGGRLASPGRLSRAGWASNLAMTWFDCGALGAWGAEGRVFVYKRVPVNKIISGFDQEIGKRRRKKANDKNQNENDKSK